MRRPEPTDYWQPAPLPMGIWQAAGGPLLTPEAVAEARPVLERAAAAGVGSVTDARGYTWRFQVMTLTPSDIIPDPDDTEDDAPVADDANPGDGEESTDETEDAPA